MIAESFLSDTDMHVLSWGFLESISITFQVSKTPVDENLASNMYCIKNAAEEVLSGKAPAREAMLNK